MMNPVIMTVDDSRSLRQMVNFTLTQADYSVVEAADGVDALEKLKNDKVNMMFVDLNMPRMDGIELIQEVRKMPEYRFVPIIMLTTESQNEKKQLGRSVGATGWIVKPFNPEQLTSVVRKVLPHGQMYH